jgi:hypothetical protein
MEQGRSDVTQHYCAGDSSGDGATPEIALGHCQLIFLTAFETGFEPGGKTSRWLDRGKVSEEQKRASDFRVVLRTALALSEMSLHANQLDTGERIVYEG